MNPTYEPRREHIAAAVESILTQTFTDWHLFIRDDCSRRENVESHVKPYLADPRISFRRGETNLGIGGNWNACWQSSSSPPPSGEGLGVGEDFIAFLFQDDLWAPRYLEASIGTLDQESRAGFTAAEHSYRSEGNVPTSPLYEGLKHTKEAWLTPGFHEGYPFLLRWLTHGLKPNIIGEPCFLVLRRSLMEAVGPFSETMVQFLDCEYWARCLLNAGFVYLPEDLGTFRVHPSGTSAVNQRLGRGAFERFTTLWSTVEHLPPADRHLGETAAVHALSDMIEQYLARRKQGQPVSNSGSGAVKKFCLKHPVLTVRAILQWLVNNEQLTVNG